MSKQSSNMVEQITVRLNGEISGFQNALSKAQKSVNDFGSSDSAKKFDTTLAQISKKMSDIYTKNNQPNKTMGTFKTMENQVSNVGLELDQLSKKLDNLDAKQKLSLLPAGEGEKLQKALQTLKEVERLDKARKTQAVGRKVELTREKEALEAKGAKEISRKEVVRDHREKYQKTTEARRSELQKNISDYEKQAQAAKEYSEALNKVNELERKRSQEGLTDKQKSSLDDKIKVAKEKMPAEATAPTGNIEYWREQLDELDQKYEANGSKLKELNKEIRAYNIEVDKNKKALEEVDNELTDTSKAYEQLKYKLAEAGLSVEQLEKELKLDPGTIKTYDDLKLRINELVSQGLGKADVLVNDFKNEVNELSQKNRELGQSTREATSSIEQENEALRRVDGIKSRIQQFLGLQGVMQVARRAMQNAYQTIKDLDAAMTEMATVTDLGVGDYWEQLPEYTKRANELGVAIKDTYEAATLYYQQGLKTNEVVSISNETLKMARIAGLSAEDATNKMTAALRGFNMELNETSAKRISDVYSELAAITASDTKEISNAMTKTASIASNAGMEFETTAAFLSQIIETTRESAETAGTALKTVIARFQELKKDPAEIGEVDGEVVDANKIETALRSVGVALRDTDGQFRDLDEVFLELASKWKGLDTNTQRYIATIAAGSRQQSRFIAMMSDYGRTQQLVAAANNSAGASNIQFEKTLESLASKLNRLKNAWDSFTMGIMDDELVKGGIDLLTGLLETVNKLTDALPGLSGSLAKVGIVFGGMSLGKKAAFSLLGQAGKQWRGETANESIISGQVQSSFAGFKTHRGLFRDRTSTMTNNDSVAIEIAQYEKLKQTYGEWMAIKSSGDAAAVQSAKARFQAARVETAALQGLTNKEKELIVEKLHEGVITSEQISILGKETAVRALNQGKTKQQGKELEKLSLLKQIEGKASGLQIRALGAETIAKALNAESTEEQSKELILLNKVRSIEAGLTPFQKQMLDQETLARAVQQEAMDQQGKELNQLNQARAAEKNLTTGGFFTVMMTEIGLRVSGKTATDAETAAIWKKIAAKKAEMVTNLKSQKYMLKGIGVTLAYVAAVALIAYSIYSAVQRYKELENAQAEALENTEKSIKSFSDAANKAKTALDSIADQKSGLQELQETFNGLTKGTAEWRQGLIDINSKVLELMETYPELAQYISMGSNGAMEISEAGWQAVQEKQQREYESAVYGQSAAALQKNQIQQQIAFEKTHNTNTAGQQFWRDSKSMGLSGQALGGTVGLGVGIGAAVKGAAIGAWAGPLGAAIGLVAGGLIGLAVSEAVQAWGPTQEEREQEATGGLTGKQYNDYIAKLAEEGISISGGSSKDEFKEIFNTMGFTDVEFEEVYSKIKALGSEFDELSVQMMGYKQAQETYLQSMAQAAAMNNQDIVDSDLYGAIVNASIEATKNEEGEMSKRIEAKMSDKDYVNDEGEATNKLIEEYAKFKGVTEEQVRNQIENNELLAHQMITEMEQVEVVDAIEGFQKNLFKKLDGMDPNKKALARGLLSEGGSKLTGAQLKDLQDLSSTDLTKLNDAEIGKLVSDALGVTLEELGASAQTIREAFIGSTSNQIDLQSKLNALGVAENALENIATDYAKKITEQIYNNGTQLLSGKNAEAVIKGILSFMPTEEADMEKYINAISTFDMTDLNAVQNLSAQMVELGIITKDQVEDFNLLENEMITLAAAIAKVDLNTMIAQLESMAEAESQIRKGDFNRRMSKEEAAMFTGLKDPSVEQLEALGFREVGNGYYDYIKSDVNELIRQGLNNNFSIASGATQKTAQEMAFILDAQNKIKTEPGTVLSGGYDQKALNTVLHQALQDYDPIYTNGALQAKWVKGMTSQQFLQDLQLLGVGVGSDNLSQALKKYISNELGGTEVSQQSTLDRINKELYSGEISPNTANMIVAALQQEASYLNLAQPENVFELRTLMKDKNYQGNIKLFSPKEVASDSFNIPDKRLLIPLGHLETNSLALQEAVDKIANGEIKPGTADEVGSDSWLVERSELERIYGILTGNKVVNEMSDQDLIDKISEYSTQSTIGYEKELQGKMEELEKIMYASTDPQKVLQYITELDITKTYKNELLDRFNLIISEQAKAQGATLIGARFKSTAGDTDAVEMLTITYLEAAKAFEEAGEGLSQFQDTLIASRRNTAQYDIALGKTLDTINNLYDSNLSTDWARENKELIEGVVAGNEQAIEVLTDYIALQQSIDFTSQTGVYIDSNTLSQLETYIDSLANGEAVSLNFQQFIDDFPTLAGMTEEQLKLLIPLIQAYGGAMNVAADGTIALTKIDTTGFFEELKDDIENWENPYDWLYNYNEKINALAREREQIERRISRLIEDEAYNYADIEKQTEQQLKNVNIDTQVQKSQYDNARREMALLFNNADLQKYASYNYDTGEVNVNYDELDTVDWSSERGQALENMLGRVEELRDVMQSSEDTLQDIQEETEAIYENARQGASEMYERVKDALVFREQEKIDEYSNLHEAITEAQDKLVNSLQEQIDLQRQIRDNQEKTDELNDKRTRLAYLRRDTSGANDLEILSLEKELAQGEQDMQDTLVDQAISDLQDANEKAAEQRQMQIDIAQSQLDIWSESAEIWTAVKQTIEDSLKQMQDGVPISETSMGILIADVENIKGLNPADYETKWKEIAGQAELTKLWGSLSTGALNSIFTNTQNTAKSALTAIERVAGKEGSTTWEFGKVATDHLQHIVDKLGAYDSKNDDVLIKALTYTEGQASSTFHRLIDTLIGAGLSNQAIKILDEYGDDYEGNLKGIVEMERLLKAKGIKYATGGLADFTGPAWLDGTPNKPEYVLNSAQTQKFFELVDVAESLDLQQLFGNNNKSESKGDSYFDIDINVDSIGEDYDVEQIADKIKQLIYNDATYRNVNAVRKFN